MALRFLLALVESSREGGKEQDEMAGRREAAWQSDSQQRPSHLTELSNTVIVSVYARECFFPLVYHDS